MASRTVLVTGGSGGIGRATALGLARMGAHLAIIGRDRERIQGAAVEVRAAGGGQVEVFVADLSSQVEVRRLAGEVLERCSRIEVLVNNVGGYWDTRHVTADGLERTFALNHLAPFLLTNLLWCRLTDSAPARVVTVASNALAQGRIDFDDLKGSGPTPGHNALAAPQLAAPEPVTAAYREVVDVLVAVLSCLNGQVAALEEQLASRFSAHRDAAIVRSLPGLGVVLGARVLAEFGDDSARFQTAKGRKAFAGIAPVTRSSGVRSVVVARAACNQRLVDACYLWAFAALSASLGARRCYDAHRARGPNPSSGAPGLGQSAGRHPARLPSPPSHLPRADRLAGR